MNYTGQTWNEYFTSVISNPFAQTLAVAVAAVVVILVLSAVASKISKARLSTAPRISRVARKGLERDGYTLQYVNGRATRTYRQSAPAKRFNAYR